MKRALYVFSLLVLLVAAFLAGNRFNQRGAGPGTVDSGERRILHYVDPMNPAHTTKEPGIAPCGMPMEPVYADDDTIGGSGAAGLSNSPGLVRVNQQKQQVIGVQTGEVTRSTETSTIRALGRIAADENRVYTLTAATDGWVGEVHASTTGSLVDKNQLMARIKIYDFDFFTWQRRYLTELNDARRGRAYLMLPSRGVQEMKGIPGERQAGSSRAAVAVPAPALTPLPPEETQPMEMSQSSDSPGKMPASTPPGSEPPAGNAQMGSPHHSGGDTVAMNKGSTSPDITRRRSLSGITRESDPGIGLSAADNIFYANRSRLELLNLGVGENQLAALEKDRVYISSAEMRSPVNGLVLSRNISPMQKIERGTECFRIADLHRVWVEVDLYDGEAKYIRPGMEARVSMPNQQEHLGARVSEVLPRFDAASRTLKIRLEMDNPGNVFRPDMFVDVEFLVALPESTTIPAGALIDSGKQQTVYVVIEEGVFEPRQVATGWRWGERVEIVEGLKVGEKIVVSGNFLIDSESRMKLAAARLMEEKTEKPPGEQVPVGAAAPESKAMQPAAQQAAATEKPKDPVCGMSVDPGNARAAGLFVEVQGQTYYFCSEECKEEFNLHGPPPAAAAAADPGPAAPSRHGMPTANTQLAVPKDTLTGQAPQPAPGPQASADMSGAQPSMPSAPTEPRTAPQAVSAEPAGQTVKDPVCGMSIDPGNARAAGLFVEVQGQTYYFCSEECKEEFHRHGPQPGFSAGADPGPEASSGHGVQVMKTQHAEPADISTMQDPQHSPGQQMQTDPPGDGEHDHD